MHQRLLIKTTLLLSVFAACRSKTYSQRFISNSNFDNPNRWVDAEHGVPCAGDTIRFNADDVVSVYVETNSSIKELVFPTNGEFIFANGVVWGVDESLSPCVDEDHEHVVTYNSEPYNWFNLDNWQTENGNGEILSPADLLDIEKVPCDFDSVVFPDASSWMVDIGMNVKLNRLTIWNQNYDSAGFLDYRATGRGRYQFQGDGVVTADGGMCNDAAGCVCRSADAVSIENLICDLVQPCQATSCANDFKASGQCCSSCGAMLTMSYTAIYTESAMQSLIDELKQDQQYSGLHAVLSKIGLTPTKKSPTAPFIQILVTDENTGTATGKTAKDFATMDTLGLTNVTMTSSGEGASPQTGMQGGEIAGIIIGVLVALALLALVIFLLRGRRSYSFKFWDDSKDNYDNPLCDMYPKNVSGEHAVSPPVYTATIAGLPSSDVFNDFHGTFDNPLYNEADV